MTGLDGAALFTALAVAIFVIGMRVGILLAPRLSRYMERRERLPQQPEEQRPDE